MDRWSVQNWNEMVVEYWVLKHGLNEDVELDFMLDGFIKNVEVFYSQIRE